MSSPVDLARAHLTKSTSVSPIYGFLLSGAEIHSSTSEGISVTEITLEDKHLNSKGTIHGSVSATLVDWSSGNALATLSSPSGASTDMHITFLSAAKLGERIIVEGRVDRKGRKLAFTRVEIRNKTRGDKLVATAIHTKYIEV